MPYTNVPDNLQDKMHKCVLKVQGTGKDKQSAIAICYASVVEGKAITDAPNYRATPARNCSNCSFFKVITGSEDGEGVCSKFEFETDIEFVCDMWEAAPVPATPEDVPQTDETAPAPAMDMASMMKSSDDLLVDLGSGDEVKAVMIGNNLEVGAYGIRFGKKNQPDLTGRDWFGDDTDFGPSNGNGAAAMVHHGLSVSADLDGFNLRTFKNPVQTTKDKIGVFVKHLIDMSDAYEKAIGDLILSGQVKFRWSSGAAGHAVVRDTETHQIKLWLPAEFSYTPTAAEFRLPVIKPLKSLTTQPIKLDDAEAAQENRNAEKVEAGATSQIKSQPIKEQNKMSDEVINALAEQVKQQSADIKALKDVIESAPVVSALKAGTKVEVIDNEKPFKNLGDQLLAVKAQATGEIKERQYNGLKAITENYMKATGASEASAIDGGFLLQPDFETRLNDDVFKYGDLLSRVPVTEIGPNANSKIVNRVDETSIASTLYGGVLAYWAGEAGTYTASRPKLRQDEVKLQKVTGLYYATDELLQDPVALGSEINRQFANAITFKIEDAIWEGNGVGMPLGITTGGSIISVAKETGQVADTVVYENIIKMHARLFPNSQRAASSAWFVNSDVMPQLDSLALAAGTAALEPRFVTYDANGVMRMKGLPVYSIPYASTVGDLYDIVLADLAWYDAIRKGGLQSASSIHVAFTTGEQVFRWTYRFGGKPMLNSAVTPFKGSNTVAPFVALAARA